LALTQCSLHVYSRYFQRMDFRLCTNTVISGLQGDLSYRNFHCGLVWNHGFLAYFSYFEKIKVGLCNLHPVCLCICVSLNQLLNPEPFFMKLGMHIMEPETISTSYFINPSHHSVYLYVYSPPIVVRQRLGEYVPVATNNCWRHRFRCGPCRVRGKYGITFSRISCLILHIYKSL
jgi:hypothetical protein